MQEDSVFLDWQQVPSFFFLQVSGHTLPVFAHVFSSFTSLVVASVLVLVVVSLWAFILAIPIKNMANNRIDVFFIFFILNYFNKYTKDLLLSSILL